MTPIPSASLIPTAKQSLKVEEAHYHFATAPGVKLDAAALLKSLQDSNYKVEGEDCQLGETV